MDKGKLIGITILLCVVIGIPATVALYWEIITTFISATWHAFIDSPELQDLITHMFADKATEYIVTNVAYLIVGILINILPFKINRYKAFWYVYGAMLLVVNGIIAAI